MRISDAAAAKPARSTGKAEEKHKKYEADCTQRIAMQLGPGGTIHGIAMLPIAFDTYGVLRVG